MLKRCQPGGSASRRDAGDGGAGTCWTSCCWAWRVSRSTRHAGARFPDDAPANPARGEELASAEAVLARTLAHQVERGWMWLDETHGRYLATLRGAWHMTNTQLFPWSLLHKRRIARRAAGALARLGLGVPPAPDVLSQGDCLAMRTAGGATPRAG